MNKEKKMMAALTHYLQVFRQEMNRQLDTLNQDALNEVAQVILTAKASNKRLHFSGIGKASYVAGYAASLFSSTGTPAYVLDGTEAVHGSAGQLIEGDVVVLISNSGETEELLATAQVAKNNGAHLVALTGNATSSLAKVSKNHLQAQVIQEGGPLNRAPRSSIMAQLLLVQALSVLLQEETGLRPQDYVRRHPGGVLGKLRNDEK